MADDKPIIVIKKKGGHGGAHGGAWKIAYADFVTAMMAFFMVMWLLSAAESSSRKAIASYFRRPGIFNEGSGTPLLIGSNGILNDGVPPAQYKGEMDPEGKIQAPPQRQEKTAVGSELADLIDIKIEELKKIIKKLKNTDDEGADEILKKLDAVEEQKDEMNKIAEEVKKEILGAPDLKELLGAVDVKVDADGLNIEIMDTDKSSMFALGSASILPEAQEALKKLATILDKVPNTIDIVGHTDAKPFRSRTGSYTNWELSADRANAARKMLEAQGLSVGRIQSVVGRADTELKKPDSPEDASNRRITLKIRFNLKKQSGLPMGSELINKLNAEEKKWQKTDVAKVKSPDPVHSLTVEEVVKDAEKQHNLLRGKETEDEATRIKKEKDKIFNENPVIGPAEFFDH